MIRTKALQVSLMIAAALAASGCSIFKKGNPKTPVLGQRIPVLDTEGDVQVDPAVAALPMSLPGAVATDWTQSGGNATKSMGQLALGSQPQVAFSVQAGRGSSLTARLSSAPIVVGDRVYTMDTLGAVRAFSATNGSLLWASQTPIEIRNDTPSLYGGGIAYDNGYIYATNGLGYVSALDIRTGGITWKVRPGGPLRGAPSVAGGSVYVMSQDNQIYSLKESDGSTNWSQAASLEIAGVFGSASPAVGQGTVVAGFSSGELNAYRYENGRQVWQDTLLRTSIRTSVSSLSDIDADPIIDSGQVIALGQGGRMVALELTTGQRQWELNIAGIATPWVAGDWIFVVTDEAKMICIYRSNGHIRWINQLPQWEHPRKKAGEIDYSGPVLAGNRLIVTGSNGTIIFLDPATGNYLTQTRAKSRISLPPVVANNTLYVFDDSAGLTAFR